MLFANPLKLDYTISNKGIKAEITYTTFSFANSPVLTVTCIRGGRPENIIKTYEKIH